VADLAQSFIVATAWEQVQSIWILPQIQIDGLARTSAIRVQEIFGMPYIKARTTQSTGVTQTSLHAQYAAKMVKGRTAAPNDWEEFFKQEAALGRGGILSSLFGSIAKSIVPSAGGFIDSIADAIPV